MMFVHLNQVLSELLRYLGLTRPVATDSCNRQLFYLGICSSCSPVILLQSAASDPGGGTLQVSAKPSTAASRLVMKQREHIVSPCPSVDLIQSCCNTGFSVCWARRRTSRSHFFKLSRCCSISGTCANDDPCSCICLSQSAS